MSTYGLVHTEAGGKGIEGGISGESENPGVTIYAEVDDPQKWTSRRRRQGGGGHLLVFERFSLRNRLNRVRRGVHSASDRPR